jgi:isopenicillin N synthase-like dioxygenase
MGWERLKKEMAMGLDTVPTIDISNFETDSVEAKRKVADQLAGALENVGFFVITGHGVPDQKVTSLVENARGFFAEPLETKNRAKAGSAGNTNRGYFPHEAETLAIAAENGGKRLPDLKEAFVAGREDASTDVMSLTGADTAYAPNIWPSDMPAFKEAMTSYYGELSSLTHRLLRVFAYTLDLPSDYFAGSFQDHPSILRVINYPARTNAPPPDQLRAAAHTDFGAITILKEGDATGGLQVKTKKGDWIDIRSAPGSFVINIGNVMMRWTNDRWISNLHRVVNPQTEAGWKNSRISIPYFVHPRPNAVIDCLPGCASGDQAPKYPPIGAAEFRMQQLKAAQTGSRAA